MLWTAQPPPRPCNAGWTSCAEPGFPPDPQNSVFIAVVGVSLLQLGKKKVVTVACGGEGSPLTAHWPQWSGLVILLYWVGTDQGPGCATMGARRRPAGLV